jgi:hypothetical protein
MRQELGSGLGRYEHVAVLITGTAPAIAASGSAVVM